jgi:hypothetical protein
MNTTYTIAYAGDALIAVVPDGDDLLAVIHAVEDHTGEDIDTFIRAEGCRLTNDPAPADTIIFASPNGCCGWITVREGDADVSYDYAVQ